MNKYINRSGVLNSVKVAAVALVFQAVVATSPTLNSSASATLQSENAVSQIA